MAEKDQLPKPLAPPNGHGRSDEEAVAAKPKELRRKKRVKCIAYIVVFAVFQAIIILAFALIFLRIRNPKFRVQSASFDGTFEVGNATTPSFNLNMNPLFAVKNTNFGHFKNEIGTVTFAYRGTTVGVASIEKARTRARSTKRFNAAAVLNSNNLANTAELGRDISSGILPLTSSSKLGGKIHLLKIIKKKKSAQMDCTMELVIATRQLQKVVCK